MLCSLRNKKKTLRISWSMLVLVAGGPEEKKEEFKEDNDSRHGFG
ncbi:hypothetical protein Tco_0152404, partial [Tanacetum coccineum]